MTRIQVPPYLVPSADAVSVKDWYLLSDDSIEQLPANLAHWDAGTPVRIKATIEIDTDRIYRDCELSAEAVLRIGLLWQSTGTSLRGRGTAVELIGPTTLTTFELDMSIEGGALADRVVVEVRLVLASVERSSSALAPMRPGSLLWSDSRTLILQGTGTRFPVELADFASLPRVPENAVWFLDWEPDDLNSMALGAICLYINSRNQKVSSAINQNDPLARNIIELIDFEVARTLITGALGNDDFVRNPRSCPDNSIGAGIRRLMTALYQTEDFTGLRQRASQDAALFESELQAHLKLFQEL